MKALKLILTGIAICTTLLSCGQDKMKKNINKPLNMNNIKTDTATFGQGCFWCAEAIFTSLEGVLKVTSGFSGGHVANPSYKDVCTGTTGHAEVIQVIYDPTKISYDLLLKAFWSSHDPTTLNRQGADVGTQYRSVIFYHDGHQKELAEKYKKDLDDSKIFSTPVVTEITAFTKFYPAEDYHQDYYANNKEASYCQFVIHPKLEKFKKIFADKMKK